MIKAKYSHKNVYDYLLGNYKWIQQESVFWRRNIWENAGGYINEKYKFMVDSELWTRFFLLEPLYSVDCVLGGYRTHASNRAMHNYQDCCNETEKAISVMKQKCSGDTLKALSIFRRLDKVSIHARLKKPLSKICSKYLYRKEFGNAAYKKIAWKDAGWIEQEIPFIVP